MDNAGPRTMHRTKGRAAMKLSRHHMCGESMLKFTKLMFSISASPSPGLNLMCAWCQQCVSRAVRRSVSPG